MYYEAKLINGVLHSRTTPDGEWHAVANPALTSLALAALEACDQEDRKWVFAHFCPRCGKSDPECKCARAEVSTYGQNP